MSYPPAFDPSLVEEPSSVLLCDNPECGLSHSAHFFDVGDKCSDYYACNGELRAATEAERAEILAGHADCPND